MNIASINGIDIAYLDETPTGGETRELPIVLIHGFASSAEVNWVGTLWVKALTDAGYRVIAFDNRGHGESVKLYGEDDYTLDLMARDAVGLLDYLDIKKAHVMGYSMGARITAMLATRDPDRFEKVILAGNGYSIVEGSGDWTPVKEALLAPSLETVKDPRGYAFRAFADQTGSDRNALAACVTGVRQTISAEASQKVPNEVLIAMGTKDDVAGSGEKLAEIIPNARYLPIPNRDHMRAVGDKIYINGVLDFLAET